uniref:Uncharacterized protein n=1 Tax=Steinernema glaseri TaxID=37863 RepID=A0A1I7ZZY9_9BILA
MQINCLHSRGDLSASGRSRAAENVLEGLVHSARRPADHTSGLRSSENVAGAQSLPFGTSKTVVFDLCADSQLQQLVDCNRSLLIRQCIVAKSRQSCLL